MRSINLRSSRSAPPQPMRQLLVVPFQHLWLALPIDQVQKVIRMPEIYRSGQKTLGLAQLGDRDAIVIDLHQTLYGCPNPEQERYLIVMQTNPQEWFGIPATTLPTLVRVPESALKELPPDYRDRDALGIASHLVTHGQDGQSQTLFILDPIRILIAQPTVEPPGESLTAGIE